MPTRQQQRLLFNAIGLTYLLRDEFTTAAGTPLASPRTAEPGPGQLTMVQVDGQFSISSGKMNVPAQATPAWGDQGFYGSVLARTIGRAMLSVVNYSATGEQFIGWGNGTGAAYTDAIGQVLYFTAQLLVDDNAGNNIVLSISISTSTAYQVAFVMRSSGGFILIKGGAFAAWTLLWVSAISSANAAPYMANYSAAGTMDYIRVRDLGGAFSTDNGIATLVQSSPVNGTNYAGLADGIFDMTVTAPNPLTGFGVMEYRYLDANNYWQAYFDLSGNFLVDSYVAGVTTNRISVASVITAGATGTIRAIVQGSKHNFYTLNGSTWTKRGAEVNVITVLDAATTIVFAASGAWIGSQLNVYPRTSSLFNVLDLV